MSRSGLLRSLVSAAFIVCSAISLSVSGCVEAEGRFFVDRVCVNTDGCSEEDATSTVVVKYGPKPDTNPLGACEPAAADAIDQTPACTDGFSVGLVVVNGLLSSLADKGNFNNVETSKILVYGYDVRLDTGVSERTFVYNSTASVLPDSESEPISVQVVPLGEDGQEVFQEVATAGVTAGFAGIRIYARTTGGLELETPEFFLPVTFAPYE